MSKFFEDMGTSQLLEYLQSMELRIQKIESKLNISSSSETIIDTESNSPQQKDINPDSFEFNLGEFWFARVGIFILAIGFVFLLTLPYENFNPFLPSFIGFTISAGLFLATNLGKNRIENLKANIWGAALLVFYFSTFRLFHISESPALTGGSLESISLLAVVAVCIFVRRFNASSYLTFISLTLFGATLIILNDVWLMLIFNPLIAALFVYYYIKSEKTYLLLYGVVLTYGIHLIFALSNPFHGTALALINSPVFSLYFVLIYSAIFSLVYLSKNTLKIEPGNFILLTFTNTGIAFILFQLLNLKNTDLYSFLSQVLFFAVFITIAIRAYYNTEIKLNSTIYALLGFAGLSIGIIRFTDLPNVYIFLIWQSIIVVGAAIWFKSKNIIVANFLIFLIIFVAYLSSVGSFHIVSLSFGIVALLSARLLNWQKERLTLQTEMMRNVYLAVAFFSIPFTLFKSIPIEYVGLSWLAVAIVYYLLSLSLHNFKYRWMAHLTLVATILFSLGMGLSGEISLIKVITVLASGVVFVGVSFFLAKLRMHDHSNIQHSL